MEKEGAQTVPIAHCDDIRQLTAVLAVTAAGYLCSYSAKERHQRVTHKLLFQTVEMCGTPGIIDPMKLT